jgi:hypothetical protein
MFEKHKSGALHVHALLHRTEFTPVAIFRRDWTAGFSNVRVGGYGGAAYLVKYSTKSLFDNTTKSRPRIRASRGYGRAVMLSDKEEVMQRLAAKAPVKPYNRSTDNLIDALALAEQIQVNKGEWWQLITEVSQLNGRITTEAGPVELPEIDRETGEIILPYKRSQGSQ